MPVASHTAEMIIVFAARCYA